MVLAVFSFGACAGRYAAVAPDELPELEAKLAQSPDNWSLMLRYAAGLYAVGQCDSAVTVARRGMQGSPSDALGPLVIGRCYEKAERWGDALSLYRQYLKGYSDHRGAAAVGAREMLAARAQAASFARQALARESELQTAPRDLNAIAVLPVEIAGDSSFRPLGRGLAQMIISDIGLLQRFRLVERLQIGAVIDELKLAQGGRIERTTAARVGRLISAGRMVQGLAAIPPKGDTRLEANVVAADGSVGSPAVVNGRFRDLLKLEKELVVKLVTGLGYRLSQAERELILENGTQNLAAFLAYSRGLEAEDGGDFAAARRHYAEAVRQDPGFQQARSKYRAAAVAPLAQQASSSDITRLAGEDVIEPAPGFENPVVAAVQSTIGDVAATQSEQTAASQVGQTTQQASSNNTSQPPPRSTPATVIGKIRIIFKLP